MTEPTEPEAKLGSLVRLGVARQAPPDEVVLRVYLDGLRAVPAAVVDQACVELARAPRDDYESSFPSLGVLLERCKAVRNHQQMLAAPKQLREATPEPLTKAEAQAWVERLRRDVRVKRAAK
jgi:hypothetical protein